jgi:DNA-binding MarR family transcriptional regulator
MSKPQFNQLIHAPTRLAIVSLLAASESADFKFVRDSLALSDSALSKQLTILEEAGYARIRKTFVGKRPRTLVSLTKAGRSAFEGHVARLQEIVTQAGLSLLSAEEPRENARQTGRSKAHLSTPGPLTEPG